MENAQEQGKNSLDYLKPWQFKPGQSGNPGGRPKGSVSLKEYARRMLLEMSDEEKQEFMKGLDKDKIWEMGEGKPETKTDITSGGEKIVVMPAEIINKNATSSSPKPNSQ